MYPYLNDAVLFTTSEGYRVFSARHNKKIKITPVEEKILSLCTGMYTEKEIIQLTGKDLQCTLEKAKKVYQDINTTFLQEKILRFSKTKKKYPVFRSRLDPPFETAYLALTYRSNLPGNHCSNGNNQEEELYVSEWKDALKELVDCGCLRIFLTGGEPLLYKGVYDIIKYARSKRLAVGIITNGTLLDINTINKMVKWGVYSLHFRMYGFAATHDGYKNTESFKKVTTAIKTAVDTGITVKVTLLVNKDTLTRGNDFIALMKSLGVTDYNFNPVMESFKDDGVSITPDEYKMFYEGLPLPPEKNTENTHNHKVKNRIDYTACLIHPDGTVGLCPPFGAKETVIGDLIIEPFVDIWNSSLFKELRDVDTFIHEKCGKCPYVAYCLGECMVKMYYITGEITCGGQYGHSRLCTF